MRNLLIRPLLLAIASMLALSGGAMANPTLVEDETTFFINWRECGAASQHLLETTPAALNGCGPAGGIPLGEVFAQLGQPYIQTYTTVANDGLPLTLDAARDITGEVHIHSWLGVGAGAGQVIVNGSLTGKYERPSDGRSVNVNFGTFTGEQIATPTASSVAFPFTLDIADDLAGMKLLSLSLEIEVRGVFVDSGVQTNGGKSQLVVPSLVDPATL